MSIYPEIKPGESGLLDVGDGNRIYWETSGNPEGKPAVFVHGGPGSGCTSWPRRLFDPDAYRIVLFDQRNCGRSLPHASLIDTDLTHNTTWHLVDDIERLRMHLGIERWLVMGGSWGSTLALAYSEKYTDRVTEMILFGIGTGRYTEVDWLFRGGLSMFFPQEWERLVHALPFDLREGDVVEGYSKMLHDPDPGVRSRAAHEWCLWESATPNWPPTNSLSKRFEDPVFAYAFARLVTHYVSHRLWLSDCELLEGARVLAATPGSIVNGRFDFQGPMANAWELKRAWPIAELVVEDAGHAASHRRIADALVRATNGFALRGGS